MPDFNDRVRRIKSLPRTINTSIGQHIRRGRPSFFSADWDATIDALKSLSTFGVTGGGAMITGPGGVQSIAGTAAAAGSQIQFAVVRAIPPENERSKWILVQALEKDLITNPWDGTWKISASPASKVFCFPGLEGRDYLNLVYRGETFERSTPVVMVVQISGTWYAIQLFKFNLPKREFNPLYKISDCKLPEQGA